MVPPQKGVEYIFYVGLVSQADTKLLQNNPTLAAGDVLVSTDGGATSNLDTLPAVTPANSDMVKVTVSATEMNGDNIIIVFSDAAGAEWCDKLICIQTSAQSLDTTDTAVDGIQTDLSNATDGLGALKALLDTISGYTDLIDDATNGLAAIKSEVEGLGGVAMRGTDNAALAASWTAALATALANYTAVRAGYLDNLSAGAVALEATLTAIKGAGWTDETLEAIKDAIDNIGTLAAIVDAVWDELTSGHTTEGSAGARLQDMDEKAEFDLT